MKNLKLFNIWTLLLSLAFAGCPGHPTDRPPEIHYGRDLCNECHMIIGERTFAAAFVDPEGNVFKFDDIGCLIHYQMHQPLTGRGPLWVHDYESGKWLKVNEASFVSSQKIITPMGYGLIALSSQNAAKQAALKQEGKVLGWDALPLIVRSKGQLH